MAGSRGPALGALWPRVTSSWCPWAAGQAEISTVVQMVGPPGDNLLPTPGQLPNN